MTSDTDNILKLKGGRTLGYAEYGVKGGKPLLYCHGFPASRLHAKLIDTSAKHLGFSVFSIDRPGIGLSDYTPSNALIHWADDALALMDALAIQRFSVLGISGGGPYALACASKLSSRIDSVGVVCGLGPVFKPWARQAMQWPGRHSFTLAQRMPWMVRGIYNELTIRLMRQFPNTVLSLLTIAAPEVDKTALSIPDNRTPVVLSIQEAFRQGARGAQREMMQYANHWGFDLDAIQHPIHLWHGGCDAVVPPCHAQRLSQTLPHADLSFFPDEGHFSLPTEHQQAILQALQ